MASIGPSAEELRLQLISEQKYLEDRIAHVERNFSALALDLGGMARKTARLRDKGDRIVQTLKDFSTTESGTMRKSLEGVAECLSALENCQQLKIDKMEAQVVKPLLEYDGVCRKAKEELKTSHTVREKEVSKQRNLDRVRIRDPSNRKKISQFESDLQKVKIERLRSSKTVEEYMEAFERKRTQDLKEILGEFIQAQMAYHAKALELYTVAYQHVQTVSEEETVELFQKGLHPRRRGSHSEPPGTSRVTYDPSLSTSTNVQAS